MVSHVHISSLVKPEDPKVNVFASISETLQVLRHLFRQRQVFCVEPFDLIDRGPSVLGKVEDVNFAVAVDYPHTNRRMTQGIERMSLACQHTASKVHHSAPSILL